MRYNNFHQSSFTELFFHNLIYPFVTSNIKYIILYLLGGQAGRGEWETGDMVEGVQIGSELAGRLNA